MFKKRKLQKQLRERYKNQTNTCECGYPFSLQPITMREGFGIYQVFEEYEDICDRCEAKHIRVR
jgi:hypothetical protein